MAAWTTATKRLDAGTPLAGRASGGPLRLDRRRWAVRRGATPVRPTRRYWISQTAYDPTGTVRLLELLADFGVAATFCWVGQVAEEQPVLVRAPSPTGHEIALHTWDHRYYNRMTPGGAGGGHAAGPSRRCQRLGGIDAGRPQDRRLALRRSTPSPWPRSWA